MHERQELVSNPHALLSFHEFWSGVRKQQETASGFGKLGLDHESGIGYYLWALTWGFGWVPLAAAALGAVVAVRRDVWRGLFLVPWPILFTLYMVPVNLLDNLLRPIVMGRGLKTPILVILIGVIGGTLAYGITGLFLGPIVLAVIWELFVSWIEQRDGA